MAPAANDPTMKRTPSSTGKSRDTRRVEDDEVKPYVLVGDLGKGSFATVYKGYHEETHQQVAVKTVSKSILTAKLFDNLQSEIDILKSLSHRHITKLYEILSAEKNIYLIMEYCAGGDLTNYIKKRGRVESLEYIPSPGAAPIYYPHPRIGGLDEIVVRSFLRQLARALKFLRQRKLIHRDIKPQNLLLTPASPEELAKGHPLGVPILKVADFGFARSLPNAMMAETLCGSPLYMAPEILRYEKYDAKADLWSVGAVLYEMAVGKPPFRAQNHIELLKKIENAKTVKFPDEDPHPRSSVNAAGDEEAIVVPVPADVKKLIRSLLKRNPVERSTFDEFFGSTALARSKFPRPEERLNRDDAPASSGDVPTAAEDEPGPHQPPIPAHHRVIPPEVLDPKAMIPPSRFNFRGRDDLQSGPSTSSAHEGGPILQESPRSSPHGRETHGTEMRRAPSGGSQRSPHLGPKPLSTEGSIIPGETEEDGFLRREYVLVGDTRAVEFNRAVDELTSGASRKPLRERRMVPISPLIGETQTHANEFPMQDSPPIPSSSNMTFPPLPHPYPPSLSSSPTSVASRAASNALSRALNVASKRLFGSGSGSSGHRAASHPSREYSPRRQIIIGRGTDEENDRDPLEEELLAALEELAQKTDVLTQWGDEMYEYVKAVPQKPLPDPTKFAKREGEPDKHAERRLDRDRQAEYNAVTCVSLYLLLMTFSQRGIDRLRAHQEQVKLRDPDGSFVVSEGFDDALTWFKEHFMKCNDRAALVKTWLPTEFVGGNAWLDQLVYDRALQLSRTAARKELLDQATAPDECEKLYMESLWCLYALQDDLMQTGNPFMDQDRETIATWITRTKLRLVRCQARMTMNDRERLKDARADQNLGDAERDPPPWEIKPVDAQLRQSPSPALGS